MAVVIGVLVRAEGRLQWVIGGRSGPIWVWDARLGMGAAFGTHSCERWPGRGRTNDLE